MPRAISFLLVLFVACQAAMGGPPGVYDASNLAAWCIVPFDAKKRGPEERAAMLEKLGFTKFVYDYRAEHVPTFDAEMEALQRHHIDLIGWWFPSTLNGEARHILEVLRHHGMKHCDLWVTGGGAPTKSPEEQTARVGQEALRIKPIAEEAAKLGVSVGLYNHDNWFGEPENQLAIIEELKRQGITNVGLVYNFHHGHQHLERLPALFPKMLPHLMCINLNGMMKGMTKPGTVIIPLGQGDLDLGLLKLIRDSGYHGPIGILNHTDEDAEGRLEDNLDGLKWLLPQLDGQPPGAKPQPRTWKGLSAPKNAGTAQQAQGLAVEGKKDYGVLPITVQCRAKLRGAAHFNILVASDPKASSWHWELYSYRGSGVFSVYLPGHGGEFRSGINICDNQWHDLTAQLEPERVRLYVDGKLVHDAVAKPLQGERRPGDLAFGQLSEGGLGCDGEIEKVHLSSGVRESGAGRDPWVRDDHTLGLWVMHDLAAAQKPAEFVFEDGPLHPESWPHRTDPINSHRLYDFYEKEALHFMKQKPLPELLPEYPGLDGGTFGHWGVQDDVFWADDRWNDTDLGSVMCGVSSGGGVRVTKGVSVRLGDQGELAACFDPTTGSFPLVWRGGFVHFNKARHGFMNGTPMAGAVVEQAPRREAAQPILYHGFYRMGPRVVFAYRRGNDEWLDSPWAEQGKFVHQLAKASEHPLRAALRGGPAQWPQWLETRGEVRREKPYALDTLTLPVANPWKTLFFVSGLDFFSNGDAAICTMTGEVWLCRGIDEGLEHLRWKRFATGLHQPLGLKIVDDAIYVLGRDQITRLHDLNGDDEADFYECVTNAQITSASGHDFITGLERDGEGYFYFASGNQGLCRVKPGQPLEVLATGFRNPNGLGLAADGTLTTAVQEGDWTPASAVCQVKRGAFYGAGGPKHGETVESPLVYLPRGVDNSCGGQCFAQSDRWGPLGRQLIHFSCGAANHFAILRERIGDQWQGTAVALPGDFLSGVQQGRINPHDGQLYVTGMFGWGSYGTADGCVQRVRYTGGPAYLPTALETHRNGVLITFSDAVDPMIAGDAHHHFAQCWNYRYSAAYGSPEFSVRRAGVRGHDALEVVSAQVLEGGKKLFLEIPQMAPANNIHLLVSPAEGVARNLYVTAHRLGDEFTQFPNYKPIAKTWEPAAQPNPSLVLPPPAQPNPWAQGKPGRALALEAALGLQYAQKELRAKAGERVTLTFKNPDVVPHNWVLARREKLPAVGDLANKMITDPEALSRHYVPRSADVICYTDMVMPGASFTIHFTAPEEPGRYPYLCTFPGHWVVMNGALVVEQQ